MKIKSVLSSSVPGSNESVIASGAFESVAHETKGHARVYAGGEKQFTLHLTQFKSEEGPNVHVVLIASADGLNTSKAIAKEVTKIELGPIVSAEGDQSYSIPNGVDLEHFDTVTIYCEDFDVNFGTALLHKSN